MLRFSDLQNFLETWLADRTSSDDESFDPPDMRIFLNQIKDSRILKEIRKTFHEKDGRNKAKSGANSIPRLVSLSFSSSGWVIHIMNEDKVNVELGSGRTAPSKVQRWPEGKKIACFKLPITIENRVGVRTCELCFQTNKNRANR